MPMFACRLSTVALEKGSAGPVCEVRGFALKSCADQGNGDIVGNYTAVFIIRDAITFQDLIHTTKRVRQTYLRPAVMWQDFWAQVDASLYQLPIWFSDRRIRGGIRYVIGFRWLDY